MSRAFVKEQDDKPEELAERPVSANPNMVTSRGLRLIEAEIEASRLLLTQGQLESDKAAAARAARDLRYWTRRRASARLVEPKTSFSSVGFGARVTIQRGDGRQQIFAIVGEDEADPSSGYIAYSSPMARAVMGKTVGDIAEIPGGEVEILGLEAVGPEG